MVTPVRIILTTYAPDGPVGRATDKAARIAIESWQKNLHNDGGINLHVADDGSTLPGYADGPLSPPACYWKGDMPTFSRQERGGVGASLNAGLAITFGHQEQAIYLMDDWECVAPLDLTPMVRLLEENDSIGMIRPGPPHPFTGSGEMSPYGWVLRLQRQNYAFSLRPFLMHWRFYQRYGAFLERASVGGCEDDMRDRFNRLQGPDIAYFLPEFFRWIYHVEGQPRPSLAGITSEDSFIEYRCERGHVFQWPTTGIPDACYFVARPESIRYEDAICGASIQA